MTSVHPPQPVVLILEDHGPLHRIYVQSLGVGIHAIITDSTSRLADALGSHPDAALLVVTDVTPSQFASLLRIVERFQQESVLGKTLLIGPFEGAHRRMLERSCQSDRIVHQNDKRELATFVRHLLNLRSVLPPAG